MSEKDHLTGRAQPLQRAEGDEAVTRAHVQQRVAGLQVGVVEHLVADRVQELGEILLADSGITAEPHIEQPSVPAVRSLRHNRLLCPPVLAVSYGGSLNELAAIHTANPRHLSAVHSRPQPTSAGGAVHGHVTVSDLCLMNKLTVLP